MDVRRSRLLTTAVLAVALAVACVDATTTAPPPAATGSTAAPGLTSSGATLLECPTYLPLTTTGVIGPLGGVLSLGGHLVSIPAGAVPTLTTFVLTVPASRYMKVDVTAVGVEHYLFGAPISITIDYSRCPAGRTEGKALSVWYVAPLTEAPLENMGGVNDAAARKITFTTDHLSGYIIAD